MSGSVDEASPPKSGWRCRVGPMNWMYPAEPGSTGADRMSRFHQFVAGKSGNGPGSGPFATGPLVCARRAAPAQKSPMTRRFEKRRATDPPFSSLEETAEYTFGGYPGTRVGKGCALAPGIASRRNGVFED